MTVYILRHPRPDFTGVLGGVDFYQGQGSTSSLRDVRALKEKGCLAFDQDGHAVEVEGEIHPDARVEILKAKVVEPKAEIQSVGAQDAPPADLPAPVTDERGVNEVKKPKRAARRHR